MHTENIIKNMSGLHAAHYEWYTYDRITTIQAHIRKVLYALHNGSSKYDEFSLFFSASARNT